MQMLHFKKKYNFYFGKGGFTTPIEEFDNNIPEKTSKVELNENADDGEETFVFPFEEMSVDNAVEIPEVKDDEPDEVENIVQLLSYRISRRPSDLSPVRTNKSLNNG